MTRLAMAAGTTRRGQRGPVRALEGHVRGLGRGGDGAVQTAEGIVFVPAVLPGEQVRLHVTGKRRGAARGRLVQVLTPAPERVAPACALQDRCGGCPLMICAADAQREHKRRWVEEAVAPVAAAGVTVAITPSQHQLGYRRRARMSFAVGPGRQALGYRRRAETRVLDVPECPILDAALTRALARLRETVLPHLVGEGELELGSGADGVAVARIAVTQAQTPALYDAVRRAVAEGACAGIVLSLADGRSEEVVGDPREWVPRADGPALWGAPAAFTQANASVNRALVDWVRLAAAPAGQRVLELYAGHGNLTVSLAADAARVVAIEQHPGQARLCQENLRARALDNTKVIAADVHPLPRLGPIDVVVLDPPRTGARDVLPGILALRPARIVYVSCDPPTLGRDLRELHAAGYVADRAHAFDMFPQTAHVEAAVRLQRA